MPTSSLPAAPVATPAPASLRLAIRDLREVLAGGIFMAVGVTCAVLSQQYALGTAMRMGAGYFPALIGGLLALLGMLIAGRGLSLSRQPGEQGTLLVWRPSLFIASGVSAFVLLLPGFGLALATLALTVLSGLARREAKWPELVALGAALGLFAVLVFIQGLGLNLPALPV